MISTRGWHRHTMQILTTITLAKDGTALIVKAVNPALSEKTHTYTHITRTPEKMCPQKKCSVLVFGTGVVIYIYSTVLGLQDSHARAIIMFS